MDESAMGLDPARTPASVDALARLGPAVLADLLDGGPDIHAVVDAHGRVLYANARARGALGGHTHFQALLSHASRRRVDLEIWPALARGAAVWQGEATVAPDDLPVSMTAAASYTDDGAIHTVALTLRDLRPLHDAEARCRFACEHDPLTSLPNRSLLHEHVGRALAHFRRTGRALAVLVVGLDGVKVVHDNVGQVAADALLVEAAHRMAAIVRDDDIVARIGDTTFVACIAGTERLEDLRRVAERLTVTLMQPFAGPGGTVSVIPSVGIAVASAGCDTYEHLVAYADATMHRVRITGGGVDVASC